MEKKDWHGQTIVMIGGVCAGIADCFEWDILWVRIIYVPGYILAAFSGGLVYLILWLIMPEAERITKKQTFLKIGMRAGF